MSDENESGEAGERVLEGAGQVAEAIGSLLPEEGDAGRVRDALETAASTAHAAAGAAQVVRGLASAAQARDAGTATGAMGSSAARALGRRDAERVRGAARDAAAGAEALGLGAGESSDVRYELEVSGIDGRWAVQSMDFHDALNEPFELTIQALVADAHPEVSDLLGKDCALTLERTTRARAFKGIVRKARVHERPGGVYVRLVVVPALWMLGRNRDSRIYQNKSVPEILEELYRRHLGGRSRELRSELTRSYPTHEYVTQYQESDLAFMTRLCEQEGLFFFFDHEGGDHEVLVLADGTSGLASVGEEGRVPFWHDAGQAPGGEAVFEAHHTEQLGASDVVLGEYDWTHPSVAVRGERTGRGRGEPALEDYDHIDAVALYDYSAGSRAYSANDAATQAQMRAERLDLDRQRWQMQSTVLTAQPGTLLELTGCPDGALDGRRYLVVSVQGSGEATEGARGSYENTLGVVPVDVPYRPARTTPQPVALGPTTATVTGPAGEEIHTDEHGRIKVQFHWDRQGQRNERSSCWLRVSQAWGGPSWGTWFLPRIGMEVVVHFVDGNPDKPFVHGCLYNGDNHTPYPLPDEKTKSTIKSNSSPGGGGFNELRFEDKAGSEEIFLHAQKDFNEKVLNNHSTTVHANQTNTVHGKQTETVHKDQEMTVKQNRTKTVEQDEIVYVHGNRTETVHLTETLILEDCRQTTITLDEDLTIERDRTMTVTGKDTETVHGGRETTVLEFDNLKVDGGANKNTHVTGQYNIQSDRHFQVLQNAINELTIDDALFAAMVGRIQLKAGNGQVHYDAMPDGTLTINAATKIAFVCGAGRIEVLADGTIKLQGTKIELAGGSSSIKAEDSGVTTSGSSITSSASGMQEITGLLVKIN